MPEAKARKVRKRRALLKQAPRKLRAKDLNQDPSRKRRARMLPVPRNPRNKIANCSVIICDSFFKL